MNTKTKSIYAAFALLASACFALLPRAQAVTPPPDGGYPGGNTAEGTAALRDLTTGTFNTALGNFTLTLNTEGDANTGVGASALRNNTTGEDNTAVGADALNRNKSGRANTANGSEALQDNTASFNTAVGALALQNNTTGENNTAIGADALTSNITGEDNTATGAFALEFNTTGDENTAIGREALTDNTTGHNNTALGFGALTDNTDGILNTAVGSQALNLNIAGSSNTAVGNQALFNSTGNSNTAVGNNALPLTTGAGNTALGTFAGVNVATAGNVICIGSPGADVSNTCFIGNIRGETTQNNNAIPVLIDSNGQLGTANSSRRYKTDIKPMDKASQSILALKPVSFRYKVHKDTTPQFGLIAEEVAQVNPDLVIYDADGKPFTVRYDAVNAMLLNEFLKEHRAFIEEQRKVEKLEATVAQQHKDFEAALVDLKGQIQKVSAQLEPSKSAPQVVNNP